MPAKKNKAASMSGAIVTALPVRELKAYYHGQPTEAFTSTRFYWAAGQQLRESIAAHCLAKRRPAGAESLVDTAAKVEVLLRPAIGEDYTDPDFLVQSYEQKLPIDETAALAQVTMRFPRATNLHAPWEQARCWLRSFYVQEHGVPVLAILHAPHLAGSDSPVHVHGLVLMRRLSPFGWMCVHRELASDAGFAAAQASWEQFSK